MAFIVEDGTGLATATSLCDVATADTFWTDRDPTSAWSQESNTTKKQNALVRASDYLRNSRRYTRWSGIKKTYAQTMPFPRVGAFERSGQAVPENVVPWAVAQACAFLANSALAGPLQGVLSHGGQVKSETVGPISTTYMDNAPVEDVIQFVDGLLLELLRRDVVLPPVTYEEPETPSGFEDNRFENMT